MSLGSWIAIGVAIAVSILLVTVLHWLLTHQLSKVWQLAQPLVQRCTYSAYAAAIVLGINIAIPNGDGFTDYLWYSVFQHGMRIAMIASLTWLALTIAYAVTDAVLIKLDARSGDQHGKMRRLQTQVRIMRRITAAVIGTVAVAAILFTFDEVRALGAGILASAGLVGIVAGVAAQSTLGNVFAGLQLAFSDALRINDVVVVEGEWGRVDELTLSTVVVRIWDERRLILPVSHFTTHPFENWTKHGANVTGTVVFRVDWRVPIGELRAEVGEYITDHPLWDGRRWSLQVIDVLESGVVELRAVVTAADSDAQWDLRCDLREHMVTYIATHYPDSLPRRRAELSPLPEEESYAPWTTASLSPSSRDREESRPSGAATAD